MAMVDTHGSTSGLAAAVESGGFSSRRLPMAAPRWLVVAVAAVAMMSGSQTTKLLAQSYAQRGLQESVVVFEVTETQEAGHATGDQVTIMFSNRSWNSAAAPSPLMGDDVVAEFSFSGSDVKDGRLRFTRRVRDLSFREARYIRIANQSTGGWSGRTLSITIDGAPFIDNVSLMPRSGPGSLQQGLQNCKSTTWSRCVFWEREIAKIPPPIMKK